MLYLYFIIASVSIIVLAILVLVFELAIPRFKVDLSLEAKKNYRPDMAGEFAVYRRVGLKWHQLYTYADIYVAKSEAKRLSESYRTPYYF